EPDIVCLSKSIGGYGLPMAITLTKRELDIFTLAEHNGTFRGNNLAFIAATEAMSLWENDDFGNDVKAKGDFLNEFTKVVVDKYPAIKAEQRGRGLMQGVACGVDGVAEAICEDSFKRGCSWKRQVQTLEILSFYDD